jgi:hypothetical protein
MKYPGASKYIPVPTRVKYAFYTTKCKRRLLSARVIAA